MVKVHPKTEPNPGFIKQLLSFENPTTVKTEKIEKSAKNVHCQVCRFKLFNYSDSNPHEKGLNSKYFLSKKKLLDRKPSTNAVCSKLFLERMDWMGDLSEIEGIINCPKCKNKVGGWRWDGEQCSCGVWITPSIYVVKSKVDHIQ